MKIEREKRIVEHAKVNLDLDFKESKRRAIEKYIKIKAVMSARK